MSPKNCTFAQKANMIPKIIHYVWLGDKEIPEQLQQYIATWQHHMPDWEIREWNEQNFAIGHAPAYVREAYLRGKWAFVSDYVRLWALEQYGGVYLDTDVQVLKSFEPLLGDIAFIGFEESHAHLPGTCVMGCEAHCLWVKAMLALYTDIHFVQPDGSQDMTTNVQRMGSVMLKELRNDGMEELKSERYWKKNQYVEKWGLKIYTHDYFSPITSTRVMRKTDNTYSIHHFAGSWTNNKRNRLRESWLVRETINALIQLKLKLQGM